MPVTLTVSELAKVAGITKCQAQMWADREIIQPTERTDMRGTGNYRQFPPFEVRMACIIGVLVSLNVDMRMLRKVSDALRKFDLSRDFGEIVIKSAKGVVLDAYYTNGIASVMGIGMATVISLRYAYRNLNK